MEEGKRFNEDKPRMELLVPEAMVDEAKVWAFGAKKYGDYNWQKGMDWTTVIGCMMRHLTAIMRGEDIDPESGLPHVAHISTNASMLNYYLYHFKDRDDRISQKVSQNEIKKEQEKVYTVKQMQDVMDIALNSEQEEFGTVIDPRLNRCRTYRCGNSTSTVYCNRCCGRVSTLEGGKL